MNTKIGTEVAHLTRDSDTFKGQRSRSPGRFSHRGVYASRSCSGERENVFTVGIYRNVAVRRGRLEALRRPPREERGGAYCGGRPPTACLWRNASATLDLQIPSKLTSVLTAPTYTEMGKEPRILGLCSGSSSTGLKTCFHDGQLLRVNCINCKCQLAD